MSFSIALSGLTAAQNLLSVTGNNIANANSTGFKESRSEFADMYAGTFANILATTPGMGVRIANDAQQFRQGTLDSTGNTLDLGINGEGFFVLGQSLDNTQAQLYSRNGTFHANQDGYVVNNDNQPLLLHTANGDTTAAGFSSSLQALRLDTTQSAPQATTTVNESVNLNSNSKTPVDVNGATLTFNANDATTYNWSNAITTYDSLGDSHLVTNYFVKDLNTAGQWNMYSAIDGTVLSTTSTPLAFDSNGNLTNVNGAASTTLALPEYTIPDSNAAALNITLDLAKSTQLSGNSRVLGVTQDGLPVGNLSGVSIDKTGIVSANYSNGATKTLGQVALARFQNVQGLQKVGDTEWTQTISSGPAIIGEAGTSGFGAINSGSLEQSNVDIAQQLIKLIVAQQSYQANAQSITTENQAIDSVLNIR